MVLISFTDFELLSAILRISSATTAKPRPCSPARAASIAAFRPSKLEFAATSLTNCNISSVFLIFETTLSPAIFRVSKSWARCVAVAASSSVVAVINNELQFPGRVARDWSFFILCNRFDFYYSVQ